MVYGVEDLSAELQAGPLVDLKILAHRDVQVEQSGGAKIAGHARHVAGLEIGWKAEGGLVEVTRSAGDATQPTFDGAAGVGVGIQRSVVGARSAVRRLAGAGNLQREPALDSENSIRLPAAEQRVQQGVRGRSKLSSL